MEAVLTWLRKQHPWLRIKRIAWIAWLLALYSIDRGIDALGTYRVIVAREAELFLGTATLLLGLLNFKSGKYCDGNTADYLSCTRPATYYYFGWLEITLIIIGIFLILIWFMQREERQK